MPSDAKLYKSFWAKTMRSVVDLINFSPSAPLMVMYLREFGLKYMFLINT